MDFQIAVQDVYDLFYDINTLLPARGLKRFEEMLRPAAMSGLISDLLTASLATHARSLTENGYFNGHPDPRSHRGRLLSQRPSTGGYRGNRDQVDAKEGRRGRHARRALAVDVRVRLRSRYRDGAAPRPPADVIHRDLSDSRRRRGLPEKPPRRTGNANCNPPSRRRQEASGTLGLQGLKHVGLLPLVVSQSGNPSARHVEELGIALDAGAHVAHHFSRSHFRRGRTRSTERIENDPLAERQHCGAPDQRCVQTHRRRGSAPGRDRDAQGC